MRDFLSLSLLVFSAGLGLTQGACGGCNDNNTVGHLPDAPPAPDAAPDAMDPDAVSLAVINHGVPAVGVTVYFLNADGSLAKTDLTDASGNASAIVTAGGSVTAVRPFTTPPPLGGKITTDELRTFLGVKPGDHLVLSRAPIDSATATVNATAPEGGDLNTHYQVLTTCGRVDGSISPGTDSPDPSGTISLQNCHGAADIAVVATQPAVAGRARAAATETPAGLYHANAALPSDQTAIVDLRDDPYAAATDVTFTYLNNTAEATIFVQHFPRLAHGYLGPYATMVEAADTSATLAEATVPAAMAVVHSTLSSNTSQHEVVDWGPFATSHTVDLGTALVREVIAGPTFDVAAGRISWDEAGTGAEPNLTIAGIVVRRTEPELMRWHWEIVAPHSLNGIVLPHLPTDVGDWTPTVSDQILRLDAIKNIRVTGGYDAVRAHILDIHDETGPTGYAIGATGRAAIATSSQRLP